MRVAIRRSGYLLEQRVCKIIRESGYHVDTNPSFLDPLTGKSREYDVSAVIAFDLLGRKKTIDFLWFHIVCECENNEQPVVFFQSEVEPDLVHEGIKCSGLPLQYAHKGHSLSTSRFLRFEEFHHYWKWPIATQYCSFHRKNPGAPWVALHPEGHHGTLTGLLGALESEIDERYVLLQKKGLPRDTTIITFYYPLLVVGGPLYQAYESKRGLALRPTDYIQYRRESWLLQQRRVYHIDVIREPYLERYLMILHRELDTIRKRAKQNRKTILAALAHQSAEIRSNGKRIALRDLLEPSDQ